MGGAKNLFNRKNSKIKYDFRSNHLDFSLTKEALVKLRSKARRRGHWFKDLKQNECMLLDLTISIVKQVHSHILANLVIQLVNRLNEIMEPPITHLIRSEGKNLAQEISKIATSWGNKTSKTWTKDQCFKQFLTINNLSLVRD